MVLEGSKSATTAKYKEKKHLNCQSVTLTITSQIKCNLESDSRSLKLQ